MPNGVTDLSDPGVIFAQVGDDEYEYAIWYGLPVAHSEKSRLKRRGKCAIKIPLPITSSFENKPLIRRVMPLTTRRKFLYI